MEPISPRSSVKRVERSAQPSIVRPLQVPARATIEPHAVAGNAAITSALHHDFAASLHTQPKYSVHQDTVARPKNVGPAYHPRSFVAPPVLPHYTPVHRSFPFRAALIGIGVGLAAMGAYVGFHMLGGAPPANAGIKKVPAAVPIDISSQ